MEIELATNKKYKLSGMTEYAAFLESMSRTNPDLANTLLEAYQEIVLTEGIGKGLKGLLLAAGVFLTGCAGGHSSSSMEMADNIRTYMRGIDDNAQINEENVRQLAKHVSEQMFEEGKSGQEFRETPSWDMAVGITKALEKSTPDDNNSGEKLANLFQRTLNQQNKIFGIPPCCRDEDDASYRERNMASYEPEQRSHYDEESNTWVVSAN